MVEKKTLSKDTLQRKYLEVGSAEEAQVLAEFKRALTDDRSKLLNVITEQNKWFQKKELSQTGEELDATNKIFMQRMMMVAALPISRGISADSLVQTIGMYAGMMAASPAMRNMVKEKVAGFCKKGVDGIIKLTEKSTKLDPEAKEERLARWNGYKEKLVLFENGGRMPYTEESAAFAQMCIDKSAYLELREPGANYEEILEYHDQASEQLAVMCELDGLDREDVCKAHRTLVGMMVDHDPNIAEMYWDLAKGKVEKSNPHTITQMSEDEFGNSHITRSEVWTGEYEQPSGEPFEGRFSIRLPMSEGEYATEMTRIVREQFEGCKTGEDVQKVHSEISTFIKTISDPNLTDSAYSDVIARSASATAAANVWSEHNIEGYRSMVNISKRYMADHPFDDSLNIQKQMCTAFTDIADLEFESFCCDHSDAAIEWEGIYDRIHGKTRSTKVTPQPESIKVDDVGVSEEMQLSL